MNESLKGVKVGVVGAGLAGTECALYLAKRGISVHLFESKKVRRNSAQKSDNAAELVCTNSLKSLSPVSSHGILKYEMRKLGSEVLSSALKHRVPAGEALAVDREKFSKELQDHLNSQGNITWVDEDVINPIQLMEKYQLSSLVIATGPLTNEGLANWIKNSLGHDDLYFYDAIAPIVDSDTIDQQVMYFKDRHVPYSRDPSKDADYLNIPLNKNEYEAFVLELTAAEKVPPKNFEKMKYFEACLPIDLMAERGKETLRFGPMKPKGLELVTGERPYAVIQLRREGLKGDAYNLVGFQNRLTYKEQLRVFRGLPGLKNAKFLNLGSVHRNTFIDASKLLHWDLSSKKYQNVYFAGQIIGVEGYTESASMGLYVAYQIYQKLIGETICPWPKETAIGSLIQYVMNGDKKNIAPSNINFGLFPKIQLEKFYKTTSKKKSDKRAFKKEIVALTSYFKVNEFVRQASE